MAWLIPLLALIADSVVQYSAVQCSAVQCSAVQGSTMKFRAVQCSAVWYNKVASVELSAHIGYFVCVFLLVLLFAHIERLVVFPMQDFS